MNSNANLFYKCHLAYSCVLFIKNFVYQFQVQLLEKKSYQESCPKKKLLNRKSVKKNIWTKLMASYKQDFINGNIEKKIFW